MDEYQHTRDRIRVRRVTRQSLQSSFGELTMLNLDTTLNNIFENISRSIIKDDDWFANIGEDFIDTELDFENVNSYTQEELA
jgi:hypothetical protein